MDQVLDAALHLQRWYAHADVCVMHGKIGRRLRVLRAMEIVGFARITVVLGNKCWVLTAAGAMWLSMQQRVGKETFRVNEFLITHGWMTFEEACDGARTLVMQGLATVLDESGVPVSYYTQQSLVLTPKRGVVPGKEAYRRFWADPTGFEEYDHR